MKTAFICLTILGCSWLGVQGSGAATIPAGTAFTVKTGHTIASNASPGMRVESVLATSMHGGSKVLPAGTKMTIQVITSKRMASSRERLTVDVTEVMVGGKTIPVKTTGAFKLESYTGSRGVSYSPEHYNVASGRRLTFHLAAPLDF